jgi:G3E family GTPase
MTGDDIPVTLLSGSLGAGKTTLLNHLLDTADDRDIAVLVNDMGEINVDAERVSGRSAGAAGNVTELSNGCICCELRGDLDRAVMRLARERDYDHLVVEASGISEPGPVADLFTRGNASARYVLDAVVTVVDARQFHDAFGADRRVERRGAVDDGTRPLSDLLVEQVELADVVLVNKTDLVSEAELEAVVDLVGGLRPDAEVRHTSYARIAPDELLGTRVHDHTMAAGAGWRRALENEDDGDDHSHDHSHDGHAHPEEEYGVTSFVYRRRRPFDADAVVDVLGDLPVGVVRSKGTLWVAGRELHLTFGQAGPSAHVEAAGPWVATRPSFERDAYRRNRTRVDWDDRWGDRRTELVFIGTDVDEATLTDRLDGCLIDEATLEGYDPDEFDGEPFPTAAEERVVLADPTPTG